MSVYLEKMDEIEIDQLCQGQWSNGKWYPCKVVKYQDGKYEVEWEDGDTRFCILGRERLKPLFDNYVQCDMLTAWRKLSDKMPFPGPGETLLCEKVGIKCQPNKNQACWI